MKKVLVIDNGDNNCLANFLRIKNENNGRSLEVREGDFLKDDVDEFEVVVLRISPFNDESLVFLEKLKRNRAIKRRGKKQKIVVVSDCPYYSESLRIEAKKKKDRKFIVLNEPLDVSSFFKIVSE